MRPTSAVQWTQYPALWAVAALSLGIVLASSLSPVASQMLVLVAGGLGLVCIVVAAWWGQRRLVSLAPLLRTLGALLLVIAAGSLRHSTFTTPPPNSIRQMALPPTMDRPSRLVWGTVSDVPTTSAQGGTRFTLDVAQVRYRQDTLQARGAVRVALRTPPWEQPSRSFPTIREGDVVALYGVLREPRPPRNPGAFDYGAYLHRQGVCCTLSVRDPNDVAIQGDRRHWIGDLLVDARVHVRDQLQSHLPTPSARAVLEALLLGDRSAIEERTEEYFVVAGLMHLLAVSGLHVLLVGMVLYGLLRPLLMRFRLRWQAVEVLRATATIAVLGFYMLLTGARPSVVRAVVMATLFIGGIVLQRSSHSLNTLGVAAVVLLAIRPTALFDAGFQLSMSAVAAIVTLNPRLMDGVPETWIDTEWGYEGVSMVTVSMAATAGTLPVLLHHFGRASLAGLLLNVVAIPITALALTAGLMVVLAGGLSVVIAGVFGLVADLLIRLLVSTAAWGAQWLWWSEIRLANPGPWILLLLIAVTIAVAQWPRPRARWRWLVVAFGGAVLHVWMPVVHNGITPSLDVVFLNVGQGDAALVTTPQKRHILIDTGPRTQYSDAGRTVIQPYLQAHDVRHLDAVVITHPDGDHLGGLASVLQGVSVDTVYVSGWEAESTSYRQSRRHMESLSIPYSVLRAGDYIPVDPYVSVDALAPPSTPSTYGLDNENEASVVLRLRYGSTQWLFAGDVEHAGEAYLVQRYGEALASDVVKVAHHGSSTSSTLPFVRATTDEHRPFAVISVGADNAFGMPSRRVVERWSKHNAIVRTTQEGAVWLQSDGKTVRQVPWR